MIDSILAYPENLKDIIYKSYIDLIPVRLSDYYIYSVGYKFIGGKKKAYVRCSKNEALIKPFVDKMIESIPAGFKTIEDKIKLTVVISFKTRGKADLDNRLKCLQDALVKAKVIKDDSLIYQLNVMNSGKVTKDTGDVYIYIEKYKSLVEQSNYKP